MLAVNHDMDFVDYSKDYADIVVSAKNFYAVIKRLGGSILILILAVPMLVFAHVILIYLQFKLNRSVKISPSLNLDNYKKYKVDQAELNQIHDKLEKLKAIQFKNAPWFLRLLIWQIKFGINTIDLYRLRLNKKMNSLDRTTAGDFKIVSENVLWEKRVPVYEYIM